MAGSEQGTMDDETYVKRTVGPSRDALRSRPQPAGAGAGERTGTHPVAPMATLAGVLTEASDPRLVGTGTTHTAA